MDWHEGLDVAKRHLDATVIADALRCETSDLASFEARSSEPAPIEQRKLVVIGTELERLEQQGASQDELVAWFSDNQPHTGLSPQQAIMTGDERTFQRMAAERTGAADPPRSTR